MPRYFFNVHDGVAIVDDVGSDLADDDAARAEAIRASAQLLLGLKPEVFWHSEDWSMVITAEGGRRVGTLWFSGKVDLH